MSVLVKGMEMPESCGTCIMRDGLFCMASDYKRISYGSMLRREEWCPLVALPDHHGRLGDLDALLDEIAVMPIDIGFGDVDRIENIIRDMPTIVEAEGEK